MQHKRLNKILNYLTFIGLLASFVLPIVHKGLFFESEYFWNFIITIILVVLAIVRLIATKGERQRLTLLQIGLLLFIIAYACSLGSSIFAHETVFEIKRYAMLFGICITASYYFVNEKRKISMLTAIYAVGVFVAVISIDYMAERKFIILLDNFFHLFNFYGSSILIDYPVSQATGVFQYSNLYATYTMIIYLIGIIILCSDVHKYLRLFVFATCFIQVYLFVLTLSRGAYLVWGIVLTGYILLAKDRKNKIFSTILMTALPAFLLLFITYDEFSFRTFPIFDIWLKVMLAFAVSAIIYVLYELVWVKIVKENKQVVRTVKTAFYTFFICVCVIVAFLIVRHISRGAYFTWDSLVSRRHYFRIWFTQMQKSPVFGYGGNAWYILSNSYEGEGYILTRFPHSFLLKTTIETGLAGFAALAMLIFVQIRALVINTVKPKSESIDILKYTAVFITVGILMHGAMDFIFAFGYLMMLYVLLLSFAGEIE